MGKTFNVLISIGILCITINAEMVRLSDKEIVIDTETKLIWQDNEVAKTTTSTWEGAIAYCENLNFAEYSDWRLPNIKELEDVKINRMVYNNIALNGTYWGISDTNKKSILDFSINSGKKAYKVPKGQRFEDLNFYVRCVRDELKDEILFLQTKYEEKKAQQEKMKIKCENLLSKTVNSGSVVALNNLQKGNPNCSHYISDYDIENGKFEIILSSKSAQTMFLEAVKYENSNDESRAKRIYLKIMEKFSDSAVALKAADRLANLKNVETVKRRANEIERSNREAVEQLNRNAKAQSDENCKQQKKACLAGCAGLNSKNGGLFTSSTKRECESKCYSMCW